MSNEHGKVIIEKIEVGEITMVEGKFTVDVTVTYLTEVSRLTINGNIVIKDPNHMYVSAEQELRALYHDACRVQRELEDGYVVNAIMANVGKVISNA